MRGRGREEVARRGRKSESCHAAAACRAKERRGVVVQLPSMVNVGNSSGELAYLLAVYVGLEPTIGPGKCSNWALA